MALFTLNGSQKPRADNVLVIGIDFGTTFSGAAWATARDFEKGRVNTITTWPGKAGTEPKVPTELYYDEAGSPLWGYQVLPIHAPRHRFFKLLLLETEDLSQEMRASPLLQRARSILGESGKTAVDLIADYLRLLWQYVQASIIKTIGKAMVNGLVFDVVITVPAIWKQSARDKMMAAIDKAKITGRRLAGETRLSFAPEPEAAALPTLLEQQESMKKGTAYIVCDAGGGTVDLITYIIESVSPLRMREAVEGTGSLTGGVFIDQAFEKICRQRLLDHGWKNLCSAAKTSFIQGRWQDSVKQHFNPGDPQEEYILDLPMELIVGRKRPLNDAGTHGVPQIKNNRIHFKKHHIKEAFAEVFSTIYDQVLAQANKAAAAGFRVAGVILVGGVGGSPYLYDYLREKLAGRRIDILQPMRGIMPRTAICQGAVYKAFLDGMDNGNDYNVSKPVEITATISRVSVGYVYLAPFDSNLGHLQKDRFWDEVEERWWAENQMEWYLKRGDCVSKQDRVSKEVYQLYETHWDGRFDVKLYQCEDGTPPSRKTSTVTTMATLNCTLENCMPVSRIRNFVTPKGKKMKKLDYKIRMLPSGGSVTFDVEVNGTRLGMKNIDNKSLTGDYAGISLSFAKLSVA